jgi:ubiquinone/menaquinone biosynthesis C-methylase UbiE
MAKNPAQIYQEKFVPVIFQPWAPVLLDATGIVEGSAVLDVACGTGVVTRALSQRVGPDGRVVGLDFSPAMIAVAESVPIFGGASIEWVEASAQEMPFEIGEFDTVVCQQGFQFFPEKDAAAAEIYRVLKQGGTLGLAIWDNLQKNKLFLLMDESANHHVGASPFTSPFGYSEQEPIRRVLSNAGFSDIAIESRSQIVEAESGADYISVNIEGAAAVLPELKAMSPQERTELINKMTDDLNETIEKLTVDGRFRFETISLIITAIK